MMHPLRLEDHCPAMAKPAPDRSRMLRNGVTAALFATTALWPVAAHAEPISILIGIFASSVGGALTGLGFAGIGGALAGLGSFSAGAFAAGFAVGGGALFGGLLKLGLSIGISLLAEALRPKPQTPDPGQRMVNMRQNIAYMNAGYGRSRGGGPIAFWQAQPGQRFYSVLRFAHAIDAYEQLFADDRLIDNSGTQGAVNGLPYLGYLKVMTYRGQAGQAAPELLTAAFPQVTAAHDFAGISHMVAVATNVAPQSFGAVYASGREPTITAVSRNKIVYDPRTLTWGWSDNAALVIADWVTSVDGLNRGVDWASVAIEADVCDQIVLDRTGQPQKRWTLNGEYLLEEARETVRAQLGVACDAFFFERADGKVGFHVGRHIAPDVTISDRHILAAQYTSGQDGTDPVNAQVVNYVEPSRGWLEAPSAAIEADDAGDEPREEDRINVYFINSHNQACRVADRLLRVRRATWRAALTLNLQGKALRRKRFFTLDHAEAGLSLTMEIDKLVRNDDGITYEVQCHSVAETDFNFNAALQEPVPPKRTVIENDTTIEAPANVTATGVAGGLKVGFDAPGQANLSSVVRVRTHALPGQWQEVMLRSGQHEVTIAGLPAELHDVQVQFVTGSGRGSDFVPKDGSGNPTLTATPGVATPLAPPPVTFTAANGGLKATLTIVTANSPYVAGTVVRRNTTNTEVGATLVGPVYSGPNATLTVADDPLAAGTYYYFARGLNGAAAESTTATASGAVVVT